MAEEFNPTEIKTPWWNIINFYKLIGLVLIWTSAWLFMMPLKVDIASPYFNNIWGEILSVLGVYKQQTITSQQRPDFMSALVALVLMSILQFRGIFNFTEEEKNPALAKEARRPLNVILNLLSIHVHTLFFTMLTKIFLFPNTGMSVSMMDKLKSDIIMTIFAAVSITGMVLGAQSLARLLLIIFSAVCVFKNISFINQALGVWGFIAILFSAAGFYLEFLGGGVNKTKILMDLNFLIGKYDTMELKSKKESSILSHKKKGLLKRVSEIRQIEEGTTND